MSNTFVKNWQLLIELSAVFLLLVFLTVDICQGKIGKDTAVVVAKSYSPEWTESNIKIVNNVPVQEVIVHPAEFRIEAQSMDNTYNIRVTANVYYTTDEGQRIAISFVKGRYTKIKYFTEIINKEKYAKY